MNVGVCVKLICILDVFILFDVWWYILGVFLVYYGYYNCYLFKYILF